MCDEIECSPATNLPPIALSPIDRRLFLKGLISLPLATVLAMPDLAQAAAEQTRTVEIEGENGQMLSAALALPENLARAPCILLIHEWWGLNDQIKTVAQEFAKLGYIALAVDLYQQQVATSPDQARALMQNVKDDIASDTLRRWVNFLERYPASNGKVGTVGWCFGGGWALNTALTTQVGATVIYYGNVKKTPEQLKSLSSPVLGHFASEDRWINKAMVEGFSDSFEKSGSDHSLEVHWYEANHAFANPSSARYDQVDAALSWQRTLAFFQQHLF